MALKTSVASGKSSATATWNTAKKVEAGDEVVVTGGFAVEWNSALVIAKMEVTSTGTLSGSTEIKLTGSLVWASAATITWKGAGGGVTFSGTGAQSIATGGHSVAEKLTLSSAGKLKLVEGVTTTATTGNAVNHEGTGALELNGQLVTVTATFTVATGATLDGTGGGTVKLTNAATSTISISSASTVTNGTLLTLEAESTGGATTKVRLGGKALGTIIALAGLVEVEPGTGGSCVELKAMNKEAANEKGLRITKGQTLEVTGSITSNGEAGKLARIESSVAGEQAKIKHAGNLSMGNSFAVVKDIAFEGGTLYAQHGEGTGDSNVAFEAEPGVTVAGLGMVL